MKSGRQAGLDGCPANRIRTWAHRFRMEAAAHTLQYSTMAIALASPDHVSDECSAEGYAEDYAGTDTDAGADSR
ncbi:hypothetical protein NDU88_001065 [Pleurodeles waltl]|uniref:Uncharacterized protein n=1 Tax=Pleurodeles waltl TaxID=8319 RepID=A0AAV7WLJ3_PLEWA|nr:hypothetical protein NDU88_001065 [Pleurodeles waltl]